MNGQILLSTKEVTKLINRSESTLYRWWKIQGFFPAPILLGNGRACAWTKESVDNWLALKSTPTT